MDIEKLIEKANHLGMELKRDGGEFEYSIGKKFLEYATALPQNGHFFNSDILLPP